jgi:predicted membrane protein
VTLRVPPAWALALVLGLLVALRLSVLFDVGTYTIAGLGQEPLEAILLVRDLVLSLCLDLLLLAGCVALAAGGRARRWSAAALVAVLLLVEVVCTGVCHVLGFYPQAFQLGDLAVVDLLPKILASVRWPYALALIAAVAGAIGLTRPRDMQLNVPRVRLLAGAGALALACAVATLWVRAHPLAYAIGAHSPLLDLSQFEAPELTGLPTGVAVERDWAAPTALDPRWSRLETAPRDGNVVLVVLESARERDFWPSPEAMPMPELAALEPMSAMFSRAYAHEPRSLKGFEALLFGVFPSTSWKSLRHREGGIALPSLSERWTAAGLRSAFLHGGDLKFDALGQMLEGRGYERVWAKEELAAHGWGDSDEGLVKALDDFIAQAPSRRFGAVLYTRETHWPYHLPPPLESHQVEHSRGAYQETLVHAGQMVGALVAMLRTRGLFEKTVVIVTGDHGEAFGEHPDSGFGHGQHVYEESVRVPLVFINPLLFHAERDDRVVQLKDVAATAAWLAGGEPTLNSGATVFHARADPVAYLLNPLDGLAGGAVQGKLKYAFRLAPGEFALDEHLFDVDADPHEQVDLIAARRAEAEALRSRFFGWLAFWNLRWEETTSDRDRQHDRAAVERNLLGSAR